MAAQILPLLLKPYYFLEFSQKRSREKKKSNYYISTKRKGVKMAGSLLFYLCSFSQGREGLKFWIEKKYVTNQNPTKPKK